MLRYCCALIYTFCLFNIGSTTSKNVAKVKHDHDKHVHEKHHEIIPVIETHETITHACPEGYWLEGGVCVTKSEVPFIPICPPNTFQHNDDCLHFSPLRYGCPEGGELVGMECIISSERPKDISCPHGSTLIDGECEFSLDLPPFCPDGTAYVGNKCIKASPIQRHCPPTFAPFGSVCSKTDVIEPLPVCPNPMTLHDSHCIITTPVIPVCPSGTADEGDQCVAYKPKMFRCPPGYTSSGGACTRTSSVPRQASCANGADPNDRCRVVVAVPLSPVCPKGTEARNGECIRKITHPASFSCPDDYLLQGHTCVKMVPYDCSITTYEVECDETPVVHVEKHHLEYHDKHGDKRHLTDKADHVKVKHTHEKEHVHHVAAPMPLLPICRKVPIITPKTCERPMEADATPYCHEGTLKSGNLCETIAMEHMLTKCGGRTDAHGNCFVEETSPPLFSCPHGYVEGPGNSCSKLEAVEQIAECPHGTTGSHCAIISPKSCPNGICERTISEPPSFICPEGYTRTSSGIVKADDYYYKGKGKKTSYTHKSTKTICKRHIFIDLIGSCPPGLEPFDDVTCVAFAEKILEFKSHRIPADRICPVGYLDKDNLHCVTHAVHPATPICPHDAIIESSRCARIVGMIKECPHGSIADKGGCWVTRTTEPITVDTIVEGLRKQHYHTAKDHGGHH